MYYYGYGQGGAASFNGCGYPNNGFSGGYGYGYGGGYGGYGGVFTIVLVIFLLLIIVGSCKIC